MTGYGQLFFGRGSINEDLDVVISFAVSPLRWFTYAFVVDDFHDGGETASIWSVREKNDAPDFD